MIAALENRNAYRRFFGIALIALYLPLTLTTTGCASLFISKRKLPLPVAPPNVQTATADELVSRINEQWEKFQSLTATVDIQASHLKAQEGTATDYPTFRANLVLSKPNKLRVLGRLPVLQTTMFDLGSDGKSFKLVVPHNNKVYEGLNASRGTSPNWYENLRPDPIFNAMVIRGLDKDELYSVISQTVTMEDTGNKRLIAEPEYVLNIQRQKPNSQELRLVRVIYLHREDLMPYEEDLYDEKGNPETQVIYGAYKDFDGTKYPGTITLKRPQEEYQLVMSLEQVISNPILPDNQFEVKIPEGYTVQEMK